MIIKFRILKMKYAMKKLLLLLIPVCFSSFSKAQNIDAPKMHAIKYDFFSPVAGCFGFSLETTKKDFIALDIDAGFIGLKLGDYFPYANFAGGYASVGPRFYFKNRDGIGSAENFKGGYFKPQILANYYSFNYTGLFYNYIDGTSSEIEIKGSDFSASLLLCLGNQWVLSDIITFDIWFGLGYGGDWFSDNMDESETVYYDNYNNPSFRFSYVRFGDTPLLFDGGLSIGILLK